MGQHSLPSGSKLRNIVFQDQILFVGLDHGFQLTVADGRFLILPDVLSIFTLTGQIGLGKCCMPIGRNFNPETFPVLVLMDCLCRKHEAGPRSMITAVRIGNHDLKHLPVVFCCGGFYHSFPEMQSDLFGLFIGSARSSFIPSPTIRLWVTVYLATSQALLPLHC